MFERADFKVIFLIMLMAIILAVTAALAYVILTNRPDYPEGTYETVVDGTTILVNADPAKLVYIVSTQVFIPEPEVPEGGQGGENEANVTVIVETPPPATLTPIPPALLPATLPPPTPTLPVPVPPIAVLPTAVPAANQYIFLEYQVAQGDTLYSISNRHNTTIALMARFGIDATDLVPGRVIRLPVANPAYCPTSFSYVVEEGDTLSSIARKCGTTVATLLQLNGFTPNNYRLDVTGVICVPNPP